jgi:hypothetical protein
MSESGFAFPGAFLALCPVSHESKNGETDMKGLPSLAALASAPPGKQVGRRNRARPDFQYDSGPIDRQFSAP